MTTKKASTDPTFPAPPANAPISAEPPPVAPAEPGAEPIDEILDGLGKPAPDRAYAAPKSPPPRAAHDTIPADNVIVRQPTQPGLGDGLNVTPEERERLEAMMKAHARRKVEGELPEGDRDADTSPPMRRRDPPAVETDPSARARRASAMPKIGLLVAAVVALGIILFVATRHGKQSADDGAASSNTTTTTAATTATTPALTATAAETAAVPAIPTTSVESLPTATGTSTARPAATGRPVHSATTVATTQHAHTAAGTSTTQPPPPGMNLLPDDPHK